MSPGASYAVVAAARAREVSVRILIGAFIAAVVYRLAPSPYPIAWFAVMAVFQIADSLFARHLGSLDEAQVTQGQKTLYVASTALNSIVYAGITPYLWFECGEPGRWFAILASCGGMLHVSLRSYPSLWVLLAGALPHAVALFVQPIAYGLTRGGQSATGLIFVTVGAMIYTAHLVAGAKQAKDSLANLQIANAVANDAREGAERASAAKSEFLATVSHEIRTPMNAVISAAHLLKRTPLTNEQEEHVAMLTNGGEVLVGLLNDVLDISKIEAGKMILEDAELNLPEALDALIRLYQPKAAAKGVKLILETAPDLPQMVRTDPLRMRQILFNLLSNAAKFTDNGRIILRAGKSRSGAAEWLWFEVEDTGCGIDAEAMSRLFGNFEQAKATTARNHGGTGLGLAISRKLAELMGGGLTCRSMLGEGSNFRFETPLVEVVASAGQLKAEAAANDPEEMRQLSILVAEDHEVNRRIVSLFLEPLGWRLTMAVNGQEAVEAANTEPFDAILMDMQMPVMNGVEAALAIRSGQGPNATAPIIALTANALGHHREAWEPVGVSAFLTKPIGPNLLVASLLSATEQRADCSVAVA
jgi:signal transduction histidine kinase